MRSLLAGWRKFVLWDYPRASWQYDVMVGLILSFIFLTPRGWFLDTPKTATVVALPAVAGDQVIWLAAEVLEGVPVESRKAAAEARIREQLGAKIRLIGLEPITDCDSEIEGYMAFAKR